MNALTAADALTALTTASRTVAQKFARTSATLLLSLLLSLLLLLAGAGAARAQESVGGYVVQPGDTLSVIAAQYGVSVDSLAALNGITNPDLLRVGQVLLIPGASGAVPESAIPSAPVQAHPGDTVAAVARRVGADPAIVSALNGLPESARLFPGQPVRVPKELLPAPALNFGAVVSLSLPETIEQGNTARVAIETLRPVALEGNWNGTPILFAPIDVITRQVALLPVPALLEAATYPLTITYSTRTGAPVARVVGVKVVDGGYPSETIPVPADRMALLAPESVAEEETKVRAALSAFTPELAARAAFAQPIGSQYHTTSIFGIRRFYDSGPYSYTGYHAGQDFGAGVGVPVLAPAPGIVTLAETLGTRGNAVIIDHGRGLFTGYWHLSELSVAPGQLLTTGEQVGLVGNTGLSTGAHLHWEMRIFGIAVDPMQFLSEAPFP